MLTALEKLDLQDQLDDLMISAKKAKKANGLGLLDINDQIDEVMIKLGFGLEPPSAPQPERGQDHEAGTTPQIVTDFISGQYTGSTKEAFITTLLAIKEYVGVFLSLDDAKEKCREWYVKNGFQLTIS